MSTARTSGIVTLQDIADRCEVSRATVSGALRGDHRQASPATMARIVSVAREMGYDPRLSHSARRLRYAAAGRPVESGLVMLFYPLTHLQGHYNAVILRGIALGFRSSGHGMLIGQTEDTGGDLLQLLPIPFRRGEVDAALVFPSQLGTVDVEGTFVKRLRDLPVFGDRPVVTMIHGWPGCSCVRIDDRAVGRLQARHLLDLGHRDLVWFWDGKPLSTLCEQRRLGHIDALQERGLDPETHLRCAPWVWHRGVVFDDKVAAVLARWPDATGFMCTGDSFAVLLHGALARLGHRVPQDYSIVGTDDMEELPDALGTNQLTTIRLPLEQVGRRAAAVVIQQITDRTQEICDIALPVELIVRGTTAAPGRQPR